MTKKREEEKMNLSKEQKEQLLKVIEEKRNRGNIIKTKKSHEVSMGKGRKAISNKKVGGVFDK